MEIFEALKAFGPAGLTVAALIYVVRLMLSGLKEQRTEHSTQRKEDRETYTSGLNTVVQQHKESTTDITMELRAIREGQLRQSNPKGDE